MRTFAFHSAKPIRRGKLEQQESFIDGPNPGGSSPVLERMVDREDITTLTHHVRNFSSSLKELRESFLIDEGNLPFFVDKGYLVFCEAIFKISPHVAIVLFFVKDCFLLIRNTNQATFSCYCLRLTFILIRVFDLSSRNLLLYLEFCGRQKL